MKTGKLLSASNGIEPMVTATQYSRNNYATIEIPLGDIQQGVRFNKIGNINISLNEKTESYELTRQVLFEKTKKPYEYGKNLHEMWSKIIESDICVGIHRINVTKNRNCI